MKPLNATENDPAAEIPLRARVDGFSTTDFSDYLKQAQTQAGIYLSAQLDRVRAVLRSILLFGLLGIVGLLAGLTVIVISTALLCIGLAEGIAVLCGGRQWAGDLIVGAGVLGLLGVGGFIFINRSIKSAKSRVIASYERRKTQDPAR